MEEEVKERRKTFAAAHRSDKDRQACTSASGHSSSVSAKAKAEAWQATCSSLSLSPKSVFFFLRFAAGFSSSSSSSPNFLNYFFPGRWHQSVPTTSDFTFLFLSQRPCRVEPEAFCGSFSELCVLRSIIRLSALPFLPLNFSQLPKTFTCPLPLAQTKLFIPC